MTDDTPEPDDEDRKARRDYHRRYRRRKGVKPRPPLKPHGTMAAWKRHRKRGETPCPKCKAAKAAEMRAYRARRKARRQAAEET